MSKTAKIILTISLLLNLSIVYVAQKALEYRRHINEFRDKYWYVSEEFSDRDVYAEADKAVVSDSTVPNRLVFFGTQVTKNYDLNKYYPEFDAINRGIDGQRVNGYLLRFKPDVLDLSPEAVIIEISSYNFRMYNTIKEIEDYTELLSQLSRCNHIMPILTTVITPRGQFKDVVEIKELGDYNVFDSVKTYNNWLKEYCHHNDLPLVDIDGLLADENGYLSEDLSRNLVEPNDKGYQIITKAVKEELENIKEQKTVGLK